MQKKIRQMWNAFRNSVVFERGKWVVCAALVLSAGYGARTFWVLVRTESLMNEKGFMALAAEDLHPYRDVLSHSARGCRALLQAYFEGRFLDRADWAGQACLSNGQEIPEAYVALAGVREATGREEEAFNILRAANQKFKDDPSILYRLAKLLGKGGRTSDAKQFLAQAAERVPKNTNIQIETLIFLIQEKDYILARTVVERLRASNPAELNAVARLLMAQVMIKQGDSGSAKALVQQSAEEWKKLSAGQREKLQKLAPEATKAITS